MKKQPKNKLHLLNPLTYQRPIFSGLVSCIPLVDIHTDQHIDMVRRNGPGIMSGTMVNAVNEYGAGVYNIGGQIITGCLGSQLAMNNFTYMMWASTTDNTVDKIYGMGFYTDASMSCLMGRRSNNPAIVIKTAANFVNVNGSCPGHNDGNLHLFCGVGTLGSVVRMYCDGVEIASASTMDGEMGGDNPIRIGNTAANIPWTGEIAFAAVWNRSLSAAEVYELYRMGPGLQILSEEIISPFSAAVGAGTPIFIPAWAINSNQVL